MKSKHIFIATIAISLSTRKETLQEVERIGKEFWEVHEFQRIPGVGLALVLRD